LGCGIDVCVKNSYIGNLSGQSTVGTFT
jgi:hypothetical protein